MTVLDALRGRRVVVTRAEDRAFALSRLLRERGAETLEWPVLSIDGLVPDQPGDWTRALDNRDWIVFASGNGVRHLLPHVANAWPRRTRVAAVGEKTAQQLRLQGIVVHAVPPIYQAAGIVAAMRAPHASLARARVLLIRGTLSPDDLSLALRAEGAIVDELTVYRTTPNGALPAAPETFDAITFASGSAARFAAPAFEPAARAAQCAACIGPLTTRIAREAGWTVRVEARVHTIEGLVDALADYFNPERPNTRSDKSMRHEAHP